MGTPYPLEKKNQILGRILSKEITVEQAHREYSIATSCVYRWLRQLKADGRSGGQGTQAIPLPQGMNFRAALVAEGYCWLFLFIGTALLKHWDGGFLKIGTEA